MRKRITGAVVGRAIAMAVLAGLLATLLPSGLGARPAEAQDAGDGTFYLRNRNSGGAADATFRYGRAGDIPIAGDWNANGTTTVGIVRDGTFHLRNRNSGGRADLTFSYGRAGDVPVVGDWNGDGMTTVGVRRGNTFYLRNRNGGGRADVTFSYGRAGDVPVVGDWNGDGMTTVGVRRGNTFYLRNRNSGGRADVTFSYGRAGDVPVAGDWNGDGITTVGIVRERTFHLRNRNSGGAADMTFRYGRAGDLPLAGDWNGTGQATIGAVRRTVVEQSSTRETCEGGAWVEADKAVLDHVRPPRNLERARPAGGDADGLREALLNANRFTLGHHYDVRYARHEQDRYADVLGARARTEIAIRMPASTALSIAISLRTNAYDAGKVGRPRAFAEHYATWLTRSVACQHKSITTDGWGDTWQSAFWAYLAGKAGWLMWDRLDPIDRFYVARMVEYEANRFLDYRVPYWTNRNGTVRFPGDSKAEENSWNANVLQLATAMMPSHPNWRAWQYKNVELLVSSYAVPSDVDRDRVVNGQALSSWLDGWNAHEDGTVVNHGGINPDYMMTIHQNWAAAMVYGLAGMPTPEAAFHNAGLVYGALVDVHFDPADGFDAPGGTMYQPGSPVVYFPQGYSWGPNRPAPYLNLDTLAHAFGIADGDSSVDPAYWRGVRVTEQLRLQRRPTYRDGRTYVEPRPAEDRYAGREEYVAQMLAFAWMGEYTALHMPPRLDESDYSAKAAAQEDRLEAFSTPPPHEEEGPPTP